MLWLPFAAGRYVELTGDEAVLEEPVPFLAGPALEPGELEVYARPAASGQSAPLFEHCLRAIERALTIGPHGLPLFGSGDWNDGMNAVGREGRGESTFVGFFLLPLLREFAERLDARGDHPRAARYRGEASRLRDMLELAWDGEWYRRGYFDDGTPLGSRDSEECRIDSLSQSWAVLCGETSRRRAEQAMDAVRARLVRRGAQLILLLDPPFDKARPDPGYIAAYPPGLRENGGQYTHAALWVVLALLRLGHAEEAVDYFHLVNPVNHARTPEDAARYAVEPYVLAGDVASHPDRLGRGGWTWYTGSAGWMFRIGLEEILGLKRHGDYLEVAPRIPAQWPGYGVRWRLGGSSYSIEVRNPERVGRGALRARRDGQEVDPARVPFADDGRPHQVEVVIGRAE
jgi:cyclic beta-1,2-glucan synthetase